MGRQSGFSSARSIRARGAQGVLGRAVLGARGARGARCSGRAVLGARGARGGARGAPRSTGAEMCDTQLRARTYTSQSRASLAMDDDLSELYEQAEVQAFVNVNAQVISVDEFLNFEFLFELAQSMGVRMTELRSQFQTDPGAMKKHGDRVLSSVCTQQCRVHMQHKYAQQIERFKINNASARARI